MKDSTRTVLIALGVALLVVVLLPLLFMAGMMGTMMGGMGGMMGNGGAGFVLVLALLVWVVGGVLLVTGTRGRR